MNLSPLLLGFLLVLHLLICGAYGARIGKFAMKSATSQLDNNLENEDTMKKEDQPQLNKSDNEEKIDISCKDNEDDCSSKGKNRKLITSTSMSTSTAKPIQENLDQHGGKKMDVRRDNKAQKTPPPPPPSFHGIPSTPFDLDKHKENVPRVEYENTMDMTVMDYSPAKRKPPIHN